MANIQIRDLDDSREMDREAMRAVTGGRAGTTFSGDFSPYRTALTQKPMASSPFNWATFTSPDDSSI